MKTFIKYKFYNDFEKEEKWLNDMSKKGHNLVHYFMTRHTFTVDDPTQYIYRIEWVKKGFHHSETKEYLEFLRENGVEFVTRHLNWIYLRRPASEGEFKLFSDISSTIEHLERIKKLWTFMMLFEFSIFLFLVFADQNTSYDHTFNKLLILGCTSIFLFLRLKMQKRINKYKAKQIIQE